MKTVLLCLCLMLSANFVLAEEVAAASGSWSSTIGVWSQILIEILVPIILILVAWVSTKIQGKIGTEAAVLTEDLLTKLVKKGVNYANAWALEQEGKPTGDAKLQQAMSFIGSSLKAHSLHQVAADRLKAMIEAQLEYDESKK